jgi:predicted ribosomally synthesized peptide with SipW-like signal peptide
MTEAPWGGCLWASSQGCLVLDESGSIFKMKVTKLLAISLLVVGTLAAAGIGGTLATWSDSEVSYDNIIETGSVDLLVAKCDANWTNPGTFKDDTPYGVGLDPCFDTSLMPGNYTCYSLLWNGGCVDAKAYLYIKTISDSDSLSDYTIMRIWYDHDGESGTPLVLSVSDTITNLDCHEIELGNLPAGAVRQLKLEIEYVGPCPTSGLSFDIVFELVSKNPLVESLGYKTYGFADSEISQNTFSVPT